MGGSGLSSARFCVSGGCVKICLPFLTDEGLDTETDPIDRGGGCAFGLKSCLVVSAEVAESEGDARVLDFDESDAEEKFEAGFRVPGVKRPCFLCVGVEFKPLGECKGADDICVGCEALTGGWLIGTEIEMNVSTILEPMTFSKAACELSGKSGGMERDDEEGPDIALFARGLLVEEVMEFVRAR